jgi:RNA polymerase sigma-32 factor
LANYLSSINAVPLLSAADERELARRYSEEQDLDAARQLVYAHLRYVVSVARGFSGYGLPLVDLIQEGSVGLMKAVKRYDYRRDVRLVSFAVHWIKAEIYDYVVRNWRMVKVATTKAQRKLFFNLRKNRSRLGPMQASEIEQLAEKLQVDEHTVREMETRLGGADVSFDPILDHDDDSRSLSPAEVLAAEGADPGELVLKADEAHSRQLQLREALNSLDDRSRNIIQRRWLNDESKKPTLQMLADEYNVSAERIRQIENRALTQMRTVVAN